MSHSRRRKKRQKRNEPQGVGLGPCMGVLVPHVQLSDDQAFMEVFQRTHERGRRSASAVHLLRSYGAHVPPSPPPLPKLFETYVREGSLLHPFFI